MNVAYYFSGIHISSVLLYRLLFPFVVLYLICSNSLLVSSNSLCCLVVLVWVALELSLPLTQ